MRFLVVGLALALVVSVSGQEMMPGTARPLIKDMPSTTSGYICPMHPLDRHLSSTDKCTICSMSLVRRRLLFLVPVLFGILVAVFVTMRVVPGDPSRLVAGADAGPEELATIRAQFGLDQPLPVQFGMYLRDVVRGELGRSLKTQRPVIDEITPRLVNTVILAVLSTVFATALGVTAGVVAAAWRNSRFDHAAMMAGRRQ